MDAMERTTVYFPASLRKRVADLSRRMEKPQAQILRDAVEAYVDQQSRPPMRSIGSVSDPTISGAESEEFLRRNWVDAIDRRSGS